MTIKASPPGLQPEQYEEIEALLETTGRGRAFLAEHARRSRNLENERMLAAMERLEARLDALAREFRGEAPSGVDQRTIAPRADRVSPSSVTGAASPDGDLRLAALSKLDSLSLVDRLALFA